MQWYIFGKRKGSKSFTLIARAFTKKNARGKAKEYRKNGYEVKIVKMSEAEKRKVGKLPRRWKGTKPLTKRTLFLRAKTEKELGRRN